MNEASARAPRAILCMTGSELTRGETHDKNGPFLALELSALGIRVDEVLLVPDDAGLLEAAIARAVERAELVVLSGGLGPTADDLTVQVLGKVFARAVYRHPGAKENMRRRAIARGVPEDRLPANYWKQSEAIEGAEVLLNPVGLAPGMIIETARGILVVLPGVPRELHALWHERVLPELPRRLRFVPPRIWRAKILGAAESLAEARIQALGIDLARIEYGISARPGELLVKFLAHEESDSAEIDRVRELLAREFAEDLVELPEGLLDASRAPIETEHSAIVHRLLLASKRTLATAESCTGGRIAKELTDHSGSSAYFLGSVVAYADRVKEGFLGVDAGLLEARGAVSAEVCAAMAEGARARFEADFALATTGIAGPTGATAEKPAGLVYVGLAEAGRVPTIVESHTFRGDRDAVRNQACVRALELLRRALLRG